MCWLSRMSCISLMRSASRGNPRVSGADALGRGIAAGRLSGFAADDYLSKFEFPELVARLRALERRMQSARPPLLES